MIDEDHWRGFALQAFELHPSEDIGDHVDIAPGGPQESWRSCELALNAWDRPRKTST
ncbi:MAG TPA: hypothetical protein VEF72_23835 [Mycobacterium sp.]|nr:hypothetical protein [Mycobacterium sp.]